MTGNVIDNLRFKFKKLNPEFNQSTFFIDTDYGKLRVLDTKEKKPIIINVPDGPNVIEHQQKLIEKLSANFRVICFEYPGLGFSFPNSNYNYTIEAGTNVLLQIMNILKLEKVSLLFSCSNGYYAINLAEKNPDRLNHIFLAQTPSISSIVNWTKKSIPNILEIPLIGQTTNALFEKKFVELWYKYSLPKENEDDTFKNTALNSLKHGGCFCLSSLVQGLKKTLTNNYGLKMYPQP